MAVQLTAYCLVAATLLGAPPVDADEPPDKGALARLVERGATPAVRARAARRVGELGETGRPAARALCGALFDPSHSVREAAAEALEKVHADVYWPARTLLKTDDLAAHPKAAAALARLGPGGNAATPVLLRHLRAALQEHEILGLRVRLAELDAQGRKDETTIRERDELEQVLQKLLAGALDRLEAPARQQELAHLRDLRTAVAEMVPADVRALAAVAGNEAAACKTIGRALRAPEVSFQLAAVNALADVARAHAEVRKSLVNTYVAGLRSGEAAVRLAAIRGLDAFGAEAAPAKTLLRKLSTGDPDEAVRGAAADALQSFRDD